MDPNPSKTNRILCFPPFSFQLSTIALSSWPKLRPRCTAKPILLHALPPFSIGHGPRASSSSAHMSLPLSLSWALPSGPQLPGLLPPKSCRRSLSPGTFCSSEQLPVSTNWSPTGPLNFFTKSTPQHFRLYLTNIVQLWTNQTQKIQSRPNCVISFYFRLY